MPQMVTEAFARGLLEKIMTEVLDVVESDTRNGKSWEQRVDEETGDVQAELGSSRAHERAHVNYSKAEELELIAKIVRDLRDIQIGDSRYVLPPSLLALEKQVKYAACNVDAEPGPVNSVETRTVQGQGDTHRFAHAAVLESPTEPTKEPLKSVRKGEEGETTSEATSVTVGLLHQLIEELESKTVSIDAKKQVASSAAVSKERIAIWEEKEEQLIRTIEGVGNSPTITTEAFQEDGPSSCFRDVELKTRPSQHYAASTSRAFSLEEIQLEKYDSSPLSRSKMPRDSAATMEDILPMSDTEARKASGEATTRKKKKKKKGLGGRLRKFLRSVFNRKD